MKLRIGSWISNPEINFQFHVCIISMTKAANHQNEYRIGTLPFMLRFANDEGYAKFKLIVWVWHCLNPARPAGYPARAQA